MRSRRRRFARHRRAVRRLAVAIRERIREALLPFAGLPNDEETRRRISIALGNARLDADYEELEENFGTATKRP